MTTILGFMNYASHDPGACIITDKNGTLEYMTISDERVSRVKNSYFFPARAIKYCMDYFGIRSFDEIDTVVVDYGFNKQLTNTTLHYRKLEADYIKTKLAIDPKKIIFADSHHTAHATSAFYPSHFDDAAVLVVDGFGSCAETNSVYVADYKNGVQLVDRAYGQGIGLVYLLVTMDILGFGIGEEGKTMGLAPLGRNVKGDPILQLNPRYDGIVTDFSEFFDRAPFIGLKQKLPRCPSRAEVTNEYYAKIAYEVQAEAERCLIHLANHAYKVTGKKKLCFAGGVALNCVANDKILANTPFEEIFIQPAASDCGVPFGLALWGWEQKVAPPRIAWTHAYMGKTYEAAGIRELLDETNIAYDDASVDTVAELIANEKIVGWFVGGSEIGPRALGHRSILADPRFAKTKDLINAKVKHREMYRPFAPSVLDEYANEYFQLSDPQSKYMLLAPHVRPERMADIPAVVHVDETARVQTVDKETSPQYYALIDAFRKKTGVPIVLNTSFNDNGEPIVETPIDALLCFLRTEIDYVYLDGMLIAKDSIADVGACVDYLTDKRRSALQKSYETALACITKGYSTEEMQDYLRMHVPMGAYYRDLHAYVDFQAALHENMDAYEHLVTDEYHVGVLRTLLPAEYEAVKANIVVLPDAMSSLAKIPDKSFVLLYNMSLYLEKSDGIYSFYKRHHRKMAIPSVGDKQKSNDFSQSNEWNCSKDWDAFYETKIV